MKQESAPTLSEHLRNVSDRFVLYPIRSRRTRTTAALQSKLDTYLDELIEWRKTFAPRAADPIEDLWTSDVRLDQMYCRAILADIPGIVGRTQALRDLVLSVEDKEAFVYLREAANCYILGLSQACVAMSRSAIENPLRRSVASVVGRGTAREEDLLELIKLAERHRLLSKAGGQRAHQVRMQGNDVLHKATTDHDTALLTFENARHVVAELAPAAKR